MSTTSAASIGPNVIAVDFGTLGAGATSGVWENGRPAYATITIGGGFGGATVLIEGSDVLSGPYATLTAKSGAASLTAAGVVQIDALPRYWRVRIVGGSGTAVTAVATVSLSWGAGVSVAEIAATAEAAIDTLYRGRTMIINVTLTTPTTSVPAGAVLADTQVIADVFREVDSGGYIQSITVIDGNDVGAAFELEFFDANVSMGTEGSAPSISDANAERSLGWMEIGVSDYKDRGGVRVASVKSLAMPVRPIAGTRDLALAAVMGPVAATYASGTILIRLGIIQD